jgi:hypothetical protein
MHAFRRSEKQDKGREKAERKAGVADMRETERKKD